MERNFTSIYVSTGSTLFSIIMSENKKRKKYSIEFKKSCSDPFDTEPYIDFATTVKSKFDSHILKAGNKIEIDQLPHFKGSLVLKVVLF